MKKKIIVGPTEMKIVWRGYSSETVSLTEADSPSDVLLKGADLWETIRPFISFERWKIHRLIMSIQRKQAALVYERLKTLPSFSGTIHRGPRPDLIAVKPWKQAHLGEWLSVPNGVAARVIRLSTHR